MAKQKRLLFLSWFFPPQNAIAAVRTGNMVRELLGHGWEITVVTAQLHNFVKPLDMTLARHHPRLHYLFVDDCLDPCQQNILKLRGIWKKSYYLTAICRKFLTKLGHHEDGIYKAILKTTKSLTADSFDLILTSGSPFCQFKAAAILAEHLKCPYVLDYRDPWSQNQHLKHLPGRIMRQEKKLLCGAQAVLAATPSLAQMLQDLAATKVQLISNGFSETESTVTPHHFSAPTMVFAGNLYPPQITLEPIMAALARIKKDTQLRLFYCGNYANEVKNEAHRFGVADLVDCTDNLPRREAQSRIKGATLAIAVSAIGQQSATPHDQCIIPAKIYEAMSLNVPVLLIAPDDNDGAKLLDLTRAGYHFNGTDINAIADFLAQGNFATTPTEIKEDYSWKNLGHQLDTILTEAAR